MCAQATLVVTGTHDPATPPADGEFLAASIPEAMLVELAAAHLTNVECAAAFSDAICQFLAG